MASHELRIPLNSIKGSATTIIDSATVRQFVPIIGNQADQMNALVANPSDVARVETGSLAGGPESAEVAVLVDRAH